MGDYCQKCRSLEKGWDLFQREKKNKCSFEHVEFKILLRHMTGNTHKCCMFVVTVVDSKRELARDPEKVC